MAAPEEFGRHSIRLRGYDYTQAGGYYITIVSSGREHLFGEVVEGRIVLNQFGRIAKTQWERLPRKFRHIELGEFVIMPNHIHGIIFIVGGRGTAEQSEEFVDELSRRARTEAEAGRGTAEHSEEFVDKSSRRARTEAEGGRGTAEQSEEFVDELSRRARTEDGSSRRARTEAEAGRGTALDGRGTAEHSEEFVDESSRRARTEVEHSEEFVDELSRRARTEDGSSRRARTEAEAGRGTALDGRGTAEQSEEFVDESSRRARTEVEHSEEFVDESSRRARTEDGSSRRAHTEQFGKPIPGSIPTIIRSYKSAVALRINLSRQARGITVWQRNYYEHIIRNQVDHERIAGYILDNPVNWKQDDENPSG